MRDGTLLHTRFFLPRGLTKDTLDLDSNLDVVLDRSPYGQTALELFADAYVPFGVVGVGQDMRGTQMSEGNFTIW